jgi:predicted nuclease of predicted toxin-antitoxin system
LDFGSLLFTTNAADPSVLQLRLQHIVPEVAGDAVLEALVTAADALESGALVTVDPRRHRIRMLPLRRAR